MAVTRMAGPQTWKKPKRKPDAGAPVERTQSEPSVRVSTNWTPARIRTVQTAADSGTMLFVADLCDQMIRDDRFGEALQGLADSLLGAELQWEAGRRTRRKNPQEEVPLAKEAEEDWWETFSEAEYAQIIVWREMLGFCWAKLTWIESAQTGRWVPLVEFWHPRHFSYDRDRKQWKVKVDDTGTEEDCTAGDGWVVFYRRSTTRPWADGLWRGLSRWWMLKSLAISDWGVHSEKAARQIVTADEGVGAKDRKALAADLYAMSKDGVISLPHGFTYQLVEATANTRDIYEAQVEAANNAGTVAILGQNLTTEVSDSGSRAAGEVHERKENRKVRYLAESLSTTLHTQVMEPWAAFNFGENNKTKPPWHVWQVSAPDDVGQKATTLATLAGAIATLKAAGLALPEDKLRDEYGLELEELPEPPPEPGGPPGMPPGKGPPGKGLPPAGKPKPKMQYELASGLPLSGAQGFLSGQLYTDDVADAARDKSAEELAPFVARILAAVGDEADYESIRDAVYALYEDEAPPERLAELAEHAMVMAQLGGRLAVFEDGKG